MFEFPRFEWLSIWVIVIPAAAAFALCVHVADRRRALSLPSARWGTRKWVIHYALPVAGLLALSVFTPLRFGAGFICGVAFGVTGLAIALAAVLAAGKWRGSFVRVGVYKYTRNPMYDAAVFCFAGASMMAWSGAPVMGLLGLVLTARAAVSFHYLTITEEEALEKSYGDEFREYSRAVPRYFWWR
ncbi:MAG: methyltransferase [Candidatus Zixiibacteriota bacterium]|jgi:protein-S-isoprenylcysteine O-methyltransferase Ste14